MNLKDLNNRVAEEKDKEICKKCNGTGRIFKKGGEVSTCFYCLKRGKLDNVTTKM